jgi:hypothetical protein
MTQFIIEKIREAYNYAIPVVPVKPPPPGGYLHKETKNFIKKATGLRSKLKPCQKTCLIPCKKHTDPESVEYQQIKNKLKLVNLCVESMIKRDRTVYQIRRLEISK